MSNKSNPNDSQVIENLTIILRRLMHQKNLSEAELSRRTQIPQPTLHKILSGDTSDPRAWTLKSLADFFNISMDQLLTGDIDNFNKHNDASNTIQSIPIISWQDCIDAANFIRRLSPTNWNNWVVSEFVSNSSYALFSKPSMEPRFPKGTILIIDPDIIPQDGDFIVVHYQNTNEATIRGLSTDGPAKILSSICSNIAPTNLSENIQILGVLAKSIFSFNR